MEKINRGIQHQFDNVSNSLKIFCLKQEVFLIRSGHNKTMLLFPLKMFFLSFKFSVISPLKRAHSTLPDVTREHGVGYVIIWHCLIYYHCFYYLVEKNHVLVIFSCANRIA